MPASVISPFQRERLVSRLAETERWDLLVIGGGATGLGIALDAASRGYRTLLLEAADFARGTSSRSTKLIHGGVRYLAQGNIHLVYQALHERGLLRRNAPHLVHAQPFIIPCYGWKDSFRYTTGLKVYDWLSGRQSFGSSRVLGREEVLRRLPGVQAEGLTGGVEYFDGRFDDARLAVNLAQTAIEQGAVLLNYFPVRRLLKNAEGRLTGVVARDEESGLEYRLDAQSVVNATGVFVDSILQLDQPVAERVVQPSQGVHLVLDGRLMKGSDALLIPQTPDGRVLFLIPWYGYLLAGTTDTPLPECSEEPVALEEEIDFILETAGRYLQQPLSRSHIRSIFAGLRPLVIRRDTVSTKDLSRGHKIVLSPSGLITLIGGKWTTYRKMAEEAVDAAAKWAGLKPVPCRTESLAIHGAASPADDALAPWGSDAAGIRKLVEENGDFGQLLVPSLPFPQATVVWAARHELARTLEDVLARRLRLLFLDVEAALEAAPVVARLLRDELGKDDEWESRQLKQFSELAKQYLPKETISLEPQRH